MAKKLTQNLTYALVGVSILALLLIGLFRKGDLFVFSVDKIVQVPEQQDEKSPPAPVEEERRETAPERNDESLAKHAPAEEDAFAVSVDGEPLLVIIPWYEEIGQISIERYDKEGNATGKPLKSGTMVQIPDPFRAGERIRFVVP